MSLFGCFVFTLTARISNSFMNSLYMFPKIIHSRYFIFTLSGRIPNTFTSFSELKYSKMNAILSYDTMKKSKR